MKQAVDERVAGGICHLSARAFWLMLAVQAVVLVGKLALGATLRVCVPDLAVLAAGVAGVVIFRSYKGLWGRKDERLRQVEEAGLETGYHWLFRLSMICTIVFAFCDAENRLWYLPCFAVLLIPAYYLIIRSTAEGLVVCSSKQVEAAMKARMRKNVVLGALLVGLIAGGTACFLNGAFQPSGLWKALGYAVVWGLLTFFALELMLRVGEYSADVRVKTAEAAQEGAADEE